MQESPPDKLPHFKDGSPLSKYFKMRWVFLYWITASLAIAIAYEGESFGVGSTIWCFVASLLSLMLQFFVICIIPFLVRFLSKKPPAEGSSLLISFGILPFKGLILFIFLHLDFNFLIGDHIFSEWGRTLLDNMKALLANYRYPDSKEATIQKTLWLISFILESTFYFYFLLSRNQPKTGKQSGFRKDFILSWINAWTVFLIGLIVLLITSLTYPGKSIGLFIQWNLIYFGFHIVGAMILPCMLRLFRKKNYSSQAAVIITGICLFLMKFFSILAMLYAEPYQGVLLYLPYYATITYLILRDILIWTFQVALLLLAYKVLRSPIGLATLFCGIKSKVCCRPPSLSLFKKIWQNFLW